jgi:hypothetical protein
MSAGMSVLPLKVAVVPMGPPLSSSRAQCAPMINDN